MSFIQNLFSSRDNNANTETYVGQTDRIWYNPDNNTFRVSDGSTPGGLPIDYSSNANVDINSLTANTITVNTGITSTDGNINFTGNLTITGNIPVATDTKIGGVRAGPGANIGNTGLLTIDTAGLPLSFGNFTANNNILTLVNVDEDMILETSGNAEIQLIGNVGFYKSNGGGVPDPSARFLFASNDGQLTIFVPVEDPIAGGMEIIGSATGNFIAPGAPGTMLHLTGNPNVSCRLYQDSLGSYSSFVGRRYNGNTASPTQVLADEDVLRFNATAATDAGMGNVAMAQISITALEDQTTTAQGSSITFTVTPIGSPASSRVDVATITVANGVTATKFTTAGTVTATGNITGGNLSGTLITGTLATAAQPNVTSVGTLTSLTVTGNVSGGNLITGGLISATGNITGGNVAGTTFTGNVVGNVTGTATTATNLTAATSILAGSININPTAIGKNTTSTQTFTLTGLTTSHKVIVMPQADFSYGLSILAAYPSALNTLSVQFQEQGGGVDPPAFNLAYFAWV